MSKDKCEFCEGIKFHFKSCPLSEEGFKKFVIEKLKKLTEGKE